MASEDDDKPAESPAPIPIDEEWWADYTRRSRLVPVWNNGDEQGTKAGGE